MRERLGKEGGHSSFSLSHLCGWLATWAARTNVTAKMRNVPILLVIAGCHTAPEQHAAPPPSTETADKSWDGSGGAPRMRNRGDALANFALSLRGTRYVYGGATLEGFDCSGLVFYTHRHFGLDVPRTSSEQADEAESVRQRKLKRGDLVFFRIDSRKVNHVGIYIGHRQFVHAPGAGKPVTVDSLDSDFYADAYDSAGRYWDRLPR
jgi:cell wall-associated NlpC family hydrolase